MPNSPSTPMVWCPLCQKEVRLLRVVHAATLVDVHARTIYRYIDDGSIYALKVAGKTYRVCGECLFRQKEK
jgi:excisionase family DNA binding protein